MRIFNVGIREVVTLLVITLVLFGPNRMQENARKFAQGIRRFVRSDMWRTFLGAYDDVNAIKDEVIRESGIREIQDSLHGINRQLSDIDNDLRHADLLNQFDNSSVPSQPKEPDTETEPSHGSESDEL